jgi:ABC transporter DrrB family efflux protein
VSAPTIPAPWTAGDARGWIVDATVLTGRNLRHFLRQPRLIVFSTIQPIMFVVLFVYVFGGAMEGVLPGELDYVHFLLPGIFVQSAAFRSTQTAVALAEDLERGVIDRFRSMPMSRSAVIAGRTLADLVRSIVVILIMIAVGYLIGFRFQAGFISAVGAVLVVALFGLALSWIFAWLALVVPGAEAAQSASFVAIFPLVFASSIFVPIETMPAWLESFAGWSPITIAADAARALSLGGPFLDDVLATLAWTAGLVLVFATLAVRRYRRLT